MTDPVFLTDEVVVYDVLKPGSIKKHDFLFGTLYVDMDNPHIHFVQRWNYRFVLDEVPTPTGQLPPAWT